ncbi:MAG: efflux RND transporter periplasmic adaptor subunit [Hyphomicrobiaceae bacterium]|nr:efflux RND transporter periplasmic adaptor subunit [Hyphomicrobiaceae bacterium]
MPSLNSTTSTFAIAAAIAYGIFSGVMYGTPTPWSPAQAQSTAAEPGAPRVARWAASATGRVEPLSGAVRVASQAPGQIVALPAGPNEQVVEGDVLVVLDDRDAQNRLDAAIAEADVRLRERADEAAQGLAAERQEAEDALYEARRERFLAWRAFDAALSRKRTGEASDADVAKAREAIETAKKRVSAELEDLARVTAKDGLPLVTRLESGLAVARADVALAEAAYERTRIRAPFDGAVLQVFARVGETVAPSPDATLLLFGDIAKLRVRAEVEERDVAKVRVGQKVVVKADAFPDQDFTGTVTEIASALGSPRIASRGPRRPNDVDVLEVVADLEGTPPLLTGMRVDVFFKALTDVQSAAPVKSR